MLKRIYKIAEQNGIIFVGNIDMIVTQESFNGFVLDLIEECSRVAKLATCDNKVCDAIESHFGLMD